MNEIQMDGKTPNIVEENIEKLKELFPEIVVEGKVDFSRLKNVLGDYTEIGEENFRFNWYGKTNAYKQFQTQSTGTLRPQKDKSKDWDTTQNLYIEGDNLEVLKLLKNSYSGKIKMIYIDPPYNTGNDFVYHDDFSDSIANYKRITGQIDDEGLVTTDDIETGGGKHSEWLSMMYPRLLLARQLLADDGVVFISIDDNEVHNLSRLIVDVFGEENLLACFPRITKKAGKTTDAIAKNNDYILVCAKRKSPLLYLPKHTDDGFKYSDEFEDTRGKYKLNQTLDYDSLQYSPSLDYPIEIDGKILYPGQSYEKYLERKNGNHARADWAWRWSKELFEFGLENGFIVVKHYDNYSRIYTKTYQNASIKKDGNSFAIEYSERTKSISSFVFGKMEPVQKVPKMLAP